MKVQINFPGDPSVGIWSYGYDMEVPDFEPEYREQVRSLIKRLYDEIDNEFTCTVDFEDEYTLDD